ncbi:MAG: hypothetical protein IT329_08915, partial [Caldilineaceae bacterium]|nr:hypothetical protein [Caldilineaceae bacterium]
MPTKALTDLPPHAAGLTQASLAWTDQFWDARAGLLALDPDDHGMETRHSVRNSIWAALGLMLRDGPEDRARALATIAAVLDNQYDAPGTVYHGTFRRWPGETQPPDPVMWRDYDPNWRQFVGTTLALLLEEFDHTLPPALVSRIDRAVELAVIGEPPDRCTPAYTNIALMKAALMTWAGDRYGRGEWMRDGEAFGRAVYDLFQTRHTFAEYNSPTYYGVNFYALALWRAYAKSAALAQMGAAMEAALWRDVARFYHAGLRNVAGPYTRSYGMDMQRYGALLGLSIWLLVGQEAAPFPHAAGMFDHGHDYCYGPALALVGTQAPAETLPHLQAFQGERLVSSRIAGERGTPDRVATAWLGQGAMIGAEGTASDDPAQAFTRVNQFHPVTLHWQTPQGVGWMRLLHEGPVDARAGRGELAITGVVAEPWA